MAPLRHDPLNRPYTERPAFLTDQHRSVGGFGGRRAFFPCQEMLPRQVAKGNGPNLIELASEMLDFRRALSEKELASDQGGGFLYPESRVEPQYDDRPVANSLGQLLVANAFEMERIIGRLIESPHQFPLLGSGETLRGLGRNDQQLEVPGDILGNPAGLRRPATEHPETRDMFVPGRRCWPMLLAANPNRILIGPPSVQVLRVEDVHSEWPLVMPSKPLRVTDDGAPTSDG